MPTLYRASGAERRRYWEEYDIPIELPVKRRSDGGDVDESARVVNPSLLCRRGQLLLAARAMWPVAVQPPCTDVWRSHALLTSVAYDATKRALTQAPVVESSAGDGASQSSSWSAASVAVSTHSGDNVGDGLSCVADLTVEYESVPLAAGAMGRIGVAGFTVRPGTGANSSEDGDEEDPSWAESGGGAAIDGNAQAARCARLGLPPSVGLGMEDPRIFDIAASVGDDGDDDDDGDNERSDTEGDRGGVNNAEGDATAARAIESGLLISYSAPKRQPQVTDCASLSNRRAMMLMPLEPLAPPVPLYWPLASHLSDRNWLLFQRDGNLFAVFSLEPHVILSVERSGRCQERHRTTNRFFARKFPGSTAIHGGANPILVRTSRHKPYFVSVFHTKNSALQYDNYAYTFSAEPPFRIKTISRRPLSLRGKRVRFVSSITYLGFSREISEPMVGVAYGSDDEQGRLAIMPLRVLLRDMLDIEALSTDASSLSGPLSSSRLRLPFEEAEAEAVAAQATPPAATSAAATPPASSSASSAAGGSDGFVEGGGADDAPRDAPLSVAAVHDGPGQSYLMPGLRFDAPSIKMVPATGAKECIPACRGVEDCTGFSWSPNGGGQCWLKQWTGTAAARSGFVSGHFSRRASCACELRRGVALRASGTGRSGGGGGDYMGSEPQRHSSNATLVTKTSTQSYAGCCERCLQSSSCAAWTWIPHAPGGESSGGGTCGLYRIAPEVADSLLTSSGATGSGSGGGGGAVAVGGGMTYVPEEAGAISGVPRLKRSVLIVHHHPPQQRLGSDRRLIALVRQVQRLGFKVAYAGADDSDPGPVRGRRLLSQMGVHLLSPVRDADALGAFAREHDASVIVLCLWFWGSSNVPSRYLRSLRTSLPHAKLVILSDDVHHVRLLKEAEDEGRPPGRHVERVKEEELKHYFYADHVLCISELDKGQILRSLPPTKAMHQDRFSVLRHVYADGVLYPLEHRRPFEQRRGLVFVGNLNNPTNLQGLLWFLREAWPRVRAAEPSITLRVVGSLEGDGAARSGLIELMKSTPGVHAGGYVGDEELGRVLQHARVFIVPVRWATGVVTKQTLAHVHGVPTVVTPTAAQHVAPAPLDGATGVGDAWSHRMGRHVPLKVAAVAETAAEYAQAVLHVHRNASVWEELSINGARYARSGGGGKGVCPSGLAADWLAFWAKLQTGVCSGGSS